MGALLSCGLNLGPPECVVVAGYQWAMHKRKKRKAALFSFKQFGERQFFVTKLLFLVKGLRS